MHKTICIWLVLLGLGLSLGAEEQARTQQKTELSAELKIFVSGYSLAIEGKYKGALDKFTEIENQFPKSVYLDRVLFWKAWCHTELKNYGIAIKLCEELAAKYPKSAYVDDAMFKAGEIYEYYQHDYDKALVIYQKLIELFPAGEDVGSNTNRGNNAVAAQQQKAQISERRNPKQAVNEWQNVQVLNGNLRGAGRNQADDYFASRAQARIAFINANKDNDFVPLTKFTEGEVLFKEHKYDETIVKFNELLKDFPASSLADNAAYGIALCLKEAEKLEQAIGAIDGFIKAYPNSELQVSAKQLLQKWTEEKVKDAQKKDTPAPGTSK
ncbi:MAG: tetratricopeptide repeat protein [Planctomycetota bacterium]